MDNLKDLNRIDTDDFILVDRLQAPEVYADGVSQILTGYPLMKILLHTVLEAGHGSQKEVRKACAMITMDTPSALDLAFDILESCKFSEADMLDSASGAMPNRLRELLDRITPEMTPITETIRAQKKSAKRPKGKEE
ncbi:hypothetical protein [Massilia alkalitolerans]|uniref:hypothetical protein n=1 Tax=Massilia alkalitolerans TaxID=286638 RepID=UPI0028A7B1F3|nr:hypothetical protein [Massilia alkalitolerans]